MTWWQIALILGAGLAAGVAAGFMVGYLVSVIVRATKRSNKAMATRTVGSSEETPGESTGNDLTNPEEASTNAKASGNWLTLQASPSNRDLELETRTKSMKNQTTMVPLLSRRSMMLLACGLLVGALLGLGYWAMSPWVTTALASFNGMSQRISTSTLGSGPFETSVNIQVVNPGSTYMYLKDLQQKGEYYAAKAGSLPFFEYLRKEAAKEMPEHVYDVSTLSSMLSIKYDYNAQLPTIKIKVTGVSREEAVFMAGLVPNVFKSYLSAEDNQTYLQRYDGLQKQLDDTRQALVDAEKNLNSIESQAAANDILNDPAYLSLNATVAALTTQLDRTAGEVAALTAAGDGTVEFANKVAALDKTSRALSAAKTQLSDLRSKAASSSLSQNLEYQAATNKVDELRKNASDLMESLTGSVSVAPPAIDYLAVGTPSLPIPVVPDRIRVRVAVVGGAALGILLSWVLLNFRWILRGASSAAAAEEGDLQS